MKLWRLWRQASDRIKREILTFVLVSRHPATPRAVGIAAAVLVAYALSPIDLIPDFIPILGYLDDLVLIPLGVWLIIHFIPDEILAECRVRADRIPAPDRRLTLAITVVVIIVWLGTGLLLAWSFRRRIFGSG